MLQSQLWSNDQALLEAYPDSKHTTSKKSLGIVLSVIRQFGLCLFTLRRGNRFKPSHVYQHYFDSFSLVFLKNGRGGISCP